MERARGTGTADGDNIVREHLGAGRKMIRAGETAEASIQLEPNVKSLYTTSPFSP